MLLLPYIPLTVIPLLSFSPGGTGVGRGMVVELAVPDVFVSNPDPDPILFPFRSFFDVFFSFSVCDARKILCAWTAEE